MDARAADELGRTVIDLAHKDSVAEAYALLAPVLGSRTPFRLLDRIGLEVGTGPHTVVDDLLDRIASDRAEGGWVVIGSALGQWLEGNLLGALHRARAYVVEADTWHGADILGERVPGPALVSYYEQALRLLEPWREDANRWVRRGVGVAVHFWAKRSRGVPLLGERAASLLAFLEPMFVEWDMDAVKGVGWGLKTLGRAYPHIVGPWLEEQVIRRARRPRSLMLRKAATYLAEGQRARLLGERRSDET